jgi:hypothetical protein
MYIKYIKIKKFLKTDICHINKNIGNSHQKILSKWKIKAEQTTQIKYQAL